MIGIAAGVVDGVHDVEQRAVRASRFAAHRHDHGLVADLEQARLLRGRRAGAQRLDASLDLEPRLVKETIERETRRFATLRVKPILSATPASITER